MRLIEKDNYIKSLVNKLNENEDSKNNLKEADSDDYAFVGTIGEFLEEIDDAKLMSGEDVLSKNVLDFLHLLISLDYHSNYSKIKVNNLNAAANWQPGDLLEITLDDNIKLTIK